MASFAIDSIQTLLMSNKSRNNIGKRKKNTFEKKFLKEIAVNISLASLNCKKPSLKKLLFLKLHPICKQ